MIRAGTPSLALIAGLFVIGCNEMPVSADDKVAETDLPNTLAKLEGHAHPRPNWGPGPCSLCQQRQHG